MTNPNSPYRVTREVVGEFVSDTYGHAFHPLKRKGSERWESFTYEYLRTGHKVSFDISWLKDESLEDSANLPDLALEIVEDLEAALAQFAEIAADLKR